MKVTYKEYTDYGAMVFVTVLFLPFFVLTVPFALLGYLGIRLEKYVNSKRMARTQEDTRCDP